MNQIVSVSKRRVAILALLALFSFLASIVHAATNIVLSGDNLQTRIDAAAAGDTMVIQSGAYGGAITISKALTLVRSGTGDVQLQGPVAINTAGAVAISQLQFADAVSITGGALVSVQWANNEIGTIQPVEAIAAICERYGALLHIDACQAFDRVALIGPALMRVVAS